jgi:hypothetical protein
MSRSMGRRDSTEPVDRASFVRSVIAGEAVIDLCRKSFLFRFCCTAEYTFRLLGRFPFRDSHVGNQIAGISSDR